jgi:hypothetical protein
MADVEIQLEADRTEESERVFSIDISTKIALCVWHCCDREGG